MLASKEKSTSGRKLVNNFPCKIPRSNGARIKLMNHHSEVEVVIRLVPNEEYERPEDFQTPVTPYCCGKIPNATRMHPTVVATIVLIVKLPYPLMTPSPIKTRPLILCKTLARMEGARAASLTSCIGVAFWIHGKSKFAQRPKDIRASNPNSSYGWTRPWRLWRLL
jgi:hypothetical protein